MKKTGMVLLGMAGFSWMLLASVHEWFIVAAYVKPSPSFIISNNTWQKPKPESTLVEPPQVAAPPDHPPLHLVIGAHTWAIKYTTASALHVRECEGFENNETHKIWLPRREGSPQEHRETVLHEILHAVLSESRKGLYAKYSEEENTFVSPMAPQLLQVLQDNPKLVVWLQGERQQRF